MHNASDLNFQEFENYSVITDMDDDSSAMPTSGINEGDTVVLKYEDQNVRIVQVRNVGEGNFQGVVRGFEPAISVSFKEITLDDSIQFLECHVYSCVRV